MSSPDTTSAGLPLKIAVLVGSTRPGAAGKAVGRWAHEIAHRRGDADFELLDIVDFDLPLLDEPEPAMLKPPGEYVHEYTRAWSAVVASFDGFVFVTPEYNHGTSGALKNAIDFLHHEWADKAAGFVGYGYTMGARAIEHLRLNLAALQAATVRPQVGFSLFTDFDGSGSFTPQERHEQAVNTMLDHVVNWSRAMRQPRAPPDDPTPDPTGRKPGRSRNPRGKEDDMIKDLRVNHQPEMFEAIRSVTSATRAEGK